MLVQPDARTVRGGDLCENFEWLDQVGIKFTAIRLKRQPHC
jgi:hypothetical protein